MSKQRIEVDLLELVSRIGSMTDAELIKYSGLHVTIDSRVLIEELVKRLRATKRELFMCVTNQNENAYEDRAEQLVFNDELEKIGGCDE